MKKFLIDESPIQNILLLFASLTQLEANTEQNRAAELISFFNKFHLVESNFYTWYITMEYWGAQPMPTNLSWILLGGYSQTLKVCTYHVSCQGKFM